MGDITPGYLFAPREGRPGLTSTKLNAAGNGATINPSFVASKPAVSGVATGDQILLLKADGTYARVPATAVGGGGSGTAGQPAYTNSTASFTVPVVGSTVTVPVVNTSWATLGEILWIQDAGGPGVAGPMQVTAITPTSLTLLNIATSTLGVFTRTVDGLAPHSGGTTGTSNFLREDSTWAAPSVASASWDPQSGFYWYDDFIRWSAADYFVQTGGAAVIVDNYGIDSTRKFIGSLSLGTGTVSTGTVLDGICLGSFNSGLSAILPGWGPLALKWRVAFPASLPTTGAGYMARLGVGATPTGGGLSSTWWNPANMGQQAFFEYSPDNNSGQWRISTGTTAANYTNTSVAIVADTVYDLEMDVNAAGTPYTFIINGTTVATISANLPTAAFYPFALIYRNVTPATAWSIKLDYLMVKYPVSR